MNNNIKYIDNYKYNIDKNNNKIKIYFILI